MASAECPNGTHIGREMKTAKRKGLAVVRNDVGSLSVSDDGTR